MEHFPVTGVDSATDKTFYCVNATIRRNIMKLKDITDVVFYLRWLHLEVN